jgi:DNA repair exonuclease SbcCD ATPase subunit
MEKIFIANPIYDTVFKHLMENNRVARFFVETIIDQPVEHIGITQQERTYLKVPSTMEAQELTQEEITKIAEVLSVLRYDFVATIRTPEGYRKVLIEIQKARNVLDLMRFRNYLGEQYKRRDTVTVEGLDREETLPIITIYLLGFTLPETDAIVIHVSRTYRDVIAGQELHVKSEFIECLTHDSYVVQIPRIEGKSRNRLEKMLNIFEQNDFYDTTGILKAYRHDLGEEDEEVRLMVEILCRIAADPQKREEIELEWRSKEFLEEFIQQKKAYALQQQLIEENRQALEQNKQVIEQNRQALEQNKQVIKQKDKALKQNKQVIEEKNKALEEKDKALEELRKQVAALQQRLI